MINFEEVYQYLNEKEPFKFNGELYYITSQWYEHNRDKFDAWFKRISKNVR